MEVGSLVVKVVVIAKGGGTLDAGEVVGESTVGRTNHLCWPGSHHRSLALIPNFVMYGCSGSGVFIFLK